MTTRIAAILVVGALLGSCATLPPGSSFPKFASVALARPEQTHTGQQFSAAALNHEGSSAYRIISVGVDGLLLRAQMIAAAERTLDLQYYIYRGDETGRLLSSALLHAADRGVRIRILVDDGDTLSGDEQVLELAAHPSIEVRVFNPFAYRGHHKLPRTIEFLFHMHRLDYRMHNKLMVADNAVALVGGRNIGNQYFQLDPESQFADDDVFAAGPIATQLSATFDDYWNSALAIPAEALRPSHQRHRAVPAHGASAMARSRHDLQQVSTGTIDYVSLIATGEPYAGLLGGRLPLVWAHAQVVCDSPDKQQVDRGTLAGLLMREPVSNAASAVRSELLLVTPYLVPAKPELRMLDELRSRQVRVRILTNSLESAPDLAAHSGYVRKRVALLKSGVELYEVRSQLATTRGSGQSAAVSRYGTYALHGKMYVFDRERLFMGSMNFDQRSMHINTEVGLIIDSPELASQTATRFEGMVQPGNSYAVQWRSSSAGAAPRVSWHTEEDGKPVDYRREPAPGGNWQRFKVWLLSWLPLAGEL
jgi:putative cardiolipin synthase